MGQHLHHRARQDPLAPPRDLTIAQRTGAAAHDHHALTTRPPRVLPRRAHTTAERHTHELSLARDHNSDLTVADRWIEA